MGIIDQQISLLYVSDHDQQAGQTDPSLREGAWTCTIRHTAQNPPEHFVCTIHLCDMGPSAAKALPSYCDSV